jgi:hypothetical protein
MKIVTLAPTCFGSRWNHHQGEVLCLAKTTERFFLARRYRRSQYYGGLLCRRAVHTVNCTPAQQADMR